MDGKKHIEAARGAMDIFGADNVEVQIDYDRRKLWVNVNGWCALRVHNIRGYAPFPLAPPMTPGRRFLFVLLG